MNNGPRLRATWAVLAVGALVISILGDGNALIPSQPINRWLHFLVCAAATAIPCAAWRTKKAVVFSLAIVACSVMGGIALAIGSWSVLRAESVVSDLFGIAAGVLLGVNLRLSRKALGIGVVADTRRKGRRPSAI